MTRQRSFHIENSFSFEPDYYWIGPAFSVISIGQTRLAADAGLSVARLAPEGFRRPRLGTDQQRRANSSDGAEEAEVTASAASPEV